MLNLKNIRKKANLTSKELAEKLYISQSSISQYENGKRRPSIKVAKRIAELFGCTLEDIYG